MKHVVVAILACALVAACGGKKEKDAKDAIEKYANVDMHIALGELMAARSRMSGLPPELADVASKGEASRHMLQFSVPLLDRSMEKAKTVTPPAPMTELHSQFLVIAGQIKQHATDVAKALDQSDAAAYKSALDRTKKTSEEFSAWIKSFDTKMAEHNANFKAIEPSEIETPTVTRAAPNITVEKFLKEPPDWTAEALERGLWQSIKGADFTHECRVAFATVFARVMQTRAEAAKQPDAVNCTSGARYAVCTYSPASGEPLAWVFGADDDSDGDVLVAVVLGAHDWAALEPKLPTEKKGCPRPSDDPQ